MENANIRSNLCITELLVLENSRNGGRCLIEGGFLSERAEGLVFADRLCSFALGGQRRASVRHFRYQAVELLDVLYDVRHLRRV